MQHLFPLLASILLLNLAIDGDGDREPKQQDSAGTATEFVFPCDGYSKGLRGTGNFGVYIDPRRSKSVFADSYHLAEDVWLKGGTEVRSVATGRVVYSDFSPSWKDETGFIHRNFGNVIVIEHKLPPKDDKAQWICSVYVHLAADRLVEVGDQVARGELIGSIGKDQSKENGLYPAHLHFGLHLGPYIQISPSWKRELERDAREFGLPCGAEGKFVKGEITLTLGPNASVQVQFIGQEEQTLFSLLVGSTSPDYKPTDIMGWCQGYGDKQTVKEWVRPSTWIRKRKADK